MRSTLQQQERNILRFSREVTDGEGVATFVLRRIEGVTTYMKFMLEVGEIQKHLVEYNFNQLRGESVIKVNDQEVKRSVRLFNEPLEESHTIQVSGDERLQIRIEKVRKLLFGQRCRVFVNDRLYKYYEGV